MDMQHGGVMIAAASLGTVLRPAGVSPTIVPAATATAGIVATTGCAVVAIGSHRTASAAP
ncbi:hypothetical protein ABT096_07570 [Streptomyces sp. NPDC002561]|jgi:hypothetical protein|uniref:hypothetical protein n=1 Tax=unclassified Streptomyces TaxID=2593676 RepID=UPI00141CDAF8|nr:hypothetical protein EAO76_36525 [Streptomyces sp. sk2.1]